MKSLEEHNRAALDRHQRITKKRGNGIACPSCGDELYDSNDGTAILTDPPRYSVECGSCDYKGSRF